MIFTKVYAVEASWTNPREASGEAIDDDDGGERQAGGDGVSTVSLHEDISTKWIECFDETIGAENSPWERPADLPPIPETETGTFHIENPEEGGCFRDETSGEENWPPLISQRYPTCLPVAQEASGTNPRERSGAAIGDGSERNVEEGSVSTVSLPEDISTKWIECFDDTSRAVYYYNDATGESTWERPADLPPNPETETGASQLENPEEWVCFLDETSGEEYWFNVATGETRWGAVASP